MECLDILKDNCLQILSNGIISLMYHVMFLFALCSFFVSGSVEERGIMHSLMAQATLIQVKEKSPLTKESKLMYSPPNNNTSTIHCTCSVRISAHAHIASVDCLILGILSVVPLVARAVADLRECSSNGHLRDTLILQVK